MLRVTTLILVGASMTLAAVCQAQPTCSEPALSEQQLREIIAKAREARKDLPTPFAQSEVVVRRQGCHYVYIEYSLPRTPDHQNIFRVNQRGVIVDTEPVSMTCPERTLTESELADVVKRERARRKDLPAPFANTRTRVDRNRCLYLYFEYAVPEQRGNFQVFTIDPLGELIDVFRSKPY